MMNDDATTAGLSSTHYTRHQALPSLSSSVSSSSSVLSSSVPLSPVSVSLRASLKRANSSSSAAPEYNVLLPQRSASAGALMRQQHSPVLRHAAQPLRPASWVERRQNPETMACRRVSFNERVVVISSAEEQQQTTAPVDVEQPNNNIWWDESQLAMELAEDDLMEPNYRRRKRTPSARRIKQKLISSIISTSSSSSISSKESQHSSHHPAPDASPKHLPNTTKNTSSRFARSLKKLTGFIF
ncbi:hypothetical protein BJV82DRAFT_612209 [Fennellomyces sp. T-0311]|nr:hypothetical protein BJV82DRAFT_612209 [Fennellomyces sp. T-0311]